MKNFNFHKEDLQKWIDSIKKNVGFILLIEILIVALLGIASSNVIDKITDPNGHINSSINTNWFCILVLSVILYGAIQIFKKKNNVAH